MDTYLAKRLSLKLDRQVSVPFQLIELVSKNAVHLDLPKSICVNPVVHIERISRACKHLTDILSTKETLSKPFNDQYETLVVDLAASYVRPKGKSLRFLTYMLKDFSA